MAVTAEPVRLAKVSAEPQRLGDNGAKAKPSSPSLDDFVGELLQRIQPAPASEARRKTVAVYVQSVIAKAFSPQFQVQAFIYGSVPLKTYLPDGDIDLAIFQGKGAPHSLRDTWFYQLSAALQREEQNAGSQFRVRDVQVIHAEVKLVKCLVDNIVVDISYQSLGGLCTVNFLESIDRRIDEDHLFKRSIILVKAWCYYESRLLGAHNGLISTYALETMVLYIFMVYYRALDTPLKVLLKFLTVFSKFDWDNYCLSLQGPIPLASFPDPKPLPFPDAVGPPLLKEEFMADMRQRYTPPGLSTDRASTSAPRSFAVKCLNIMDPLLPTNNLGRSVNRSSFSRIRSALTRGAERLSSMMQLEGLDAIDAGRQFFRSTWNAQRPQSMPGGRKLPAKSLKALSGENLRPVLASQKGQPAQALHAMPATQQAKSLQQAQASAAMSAALASSWQHAMRAAHQASQPLSASFYQQLMQQGMQPQQRYANYLHPNTSAPSSQHFVRTNSQPLPMSERQPLEAISHSGKGRPQLRQTQSKDDLRGFHPTALSSTPESSALTPSSSKKSLSLESQGSDVAGTVAGVPPMLNGSTYSNGVASRGEQVGKANGRIGAREHEQASMAIGEKPERPASSNAQARRDGTQPSSGNGAMLNGSLHQAGAQSHASQQQNQGRQKQQPQMVPLNMAIRLPGGQSGDYFQLPMPIMVPAQYLQQQSLLMQSRMRQSGTSSAAGYPSGQAGTVPAQRQSDPGTYESTAKGVTLSGDLEGLSQSLQTAKAMFDSNRSAPPTSRMGPSYPYDSQAHSYMADPASWQHRTAHGPGASFQHAYSRGPQRSSSAGNLHHVRSNSVPNGVRRGQRPTMVNGSSLPTNVQINRSNLAHLNGAAQANGLARSKFPSRQQPPAAEPHEHVQSQVAAVPPPDLQDQFPMLKAGAVPQDKGAASRPAEKGPTYPLSPAIAAGRPNGALPNGIVPNGMTAVPNGVLPNGVVPNGMPPVQQPTLEWALTAGRGRHPLEWATASEGGRPGWSSPAGSNLSEQSLGSLRILRANGMSPAPVSPSMRGASLKSWHSGGSYEGPASVTEAPVAELPENSNKLGFVLAEEDFPVLGSSQNSTPSKKGPGGLPGSAEKRANGAL